MPRALTKPLLKEANFAEPRATRAYTTLISRTELTRRED